MFSYLFSGFLAAGGMDGALGGDQLITLAIAFAAGGLLMVLAKRLRVPGIVVLLASGVLLGPEGLNIVRPDALGGMLNVLVAMAIGLILFEGGLTLNIAGYRTASGVIRNLLTVGVAVTWVCTAVMVWLIFDVPASFAVLASSLVIVTGPTVIQPILKRIRLKWRLHSILHWESVLIDPIGVFLAVLAFEWVVGGTGDQALLNLLLRVVGGVVIGTAGGALAVYILKRKVLPDELVNVFAAAWAVLIFGVTEMFISEGGLLSVTIAGFILGYKQPPALKAVTEFKAVITDLLIGFVFILLSAGLEFEQFSEFGLPGVLLLAILILVIRPLAVHLSAIGSSLNAREKILLSWVAPRGVVAASMASLFALTLEQMGMFDNPKFIETFVYSVIITTVVLQGFSAGALAWMLKLQEKHPEGWLIVGAHRVSIEVARFLKEVRKVPVTLIDGNRRAVVEARNEGLQAIFADAREVEAIVDRSEMQGIGRLLAVTDNEDLNELLCNKWREHFGKESLYRWASTISDGEASTGVVLWSWMPKPSMISSELTLGEAAIVRLEGPRMKNPGSLAALMTAHSKELLLDPGPDSKLKSEKEAPATLYLQREADYLLNALHPDRILRLEVEDKDELFRSLAEHVSVAETSLSSEDIYQRIIERESAAPTTLGHGVAVPHAKVEGLSQTLCVIASLTKALTFYPEEPEPVRLVFLLLSPPEKPEMHLAVLGEIARLCAEASVREQLVEAEDSAEMFATIRRYRRQHTAFADARS